VTTAGKRRASASASGKMCRTRSSGGNPCRCPGGAAWRCCARYAEKNRCSYIVSPRTVPSSRGRGYESGSPMTSSQSHRCDLSRSWCASFGRVGLKREFGTFLRNAISVYADYPAKAKDEEAVETARKARPAMRTVWLLGEIGTGKRSSLRAIHNGRNGTTNRSSPLTASGYPRTSRFRTVGHKRARSRGGPQKRARWTGERRHSLLDE